MTDRPARREYDSAGAEPDWDSPVPAEYGSLSASLRRLESRLDELEPAEDGVDPPGPRGRAARGGGPGVRRRGVRPPGDEADAAPTPGWEDLGLGPSDPAGPAASNRLPHPAARRGPDPAVWPQAAPADAAPSPARPVDAAARPPGNPPAAPEDVSPRRSPAVRRGRRPRPDAGPGLDAAGAAGAGWPPAAEPVTDTPGGRLPPSGTAGIGPATSAVPGRRTSHPPAAGGDGGVDLAGVPLDDGPAGRPDRTPRPRPALAGGPEPSRRRRPRQWSQSRWTIRHVSVWGVAKVSLAFYLILLVAFVVASVLLWYLADAFGAVTSIEKSARTLFSLKTLTIHPSQVAMYTALGGALLCVVGTLLNILGALMFNLISDLIGGIRFDVVDSSER